jgi:hypothetical protein
MRLMSIFALSSLGLLGGCMTLGGMDHSRMSHEQMMQHCQMMAERHQAEAAGAAPAEAAMDHSAMNHGGMNHEEMMRHCEMMRQQQAAPAEAQDAPAAPHQH